MFVKLGVCFSGPCRTTGRKYGYAQPDQQRQITVCWLQPEHLPLEIAKRKKERQWVYDSPLTYAIGFSHSIHTGEAHPHTTDHQHEFKCIRMNIVKHFNQMLLQLSYSTIIEPWNQLGKSSVPPQESPRRTGLTRLTANTRKYHLGLTEAQYLGYKIS